MTATGSAQLGTMHLSAQMLDWARSIEAAAINAITVSRRANRFEKTTAFHFLADRCGILADSSGNCLKGHPIIQAIFDFTSLLQA
jgi:hypothetical protein